MTTSKQLQAQQLFDNIMINLILSNKLSNKFLEQKDYANKEEIELLKETKTLNDNIVFDFGLKAEKTSQEFEFIKTQNQDIQTNLDYQ